MKIHERLYCKLHAGVATGHNVLGLLKQQRGDLEGAKTCFQHALDVGKSTIGVEHHDYAVYLNNKARLLWSRDKDSREAKKLGSNALSIANEKLGPHHPQTQQLRRDWGGGES